MTLRAVALAASLLPAATLAHADPAPSFRPSRDVDITYRVPVPNAPATALLQRLRWSAATARERVDLPTSGNWMVLDTRAGRITMVRDDARQAIDMPAPADSLPGGPAPGGRTERQGSDTIADLACTEWRTTDNAGRQTVACVTTDGVMLRARDGDRVLLEAVSVRYAPQDASVFAVPAGFRHITPR